MESPIDTLVRALSRLPGLGRRSAERAAFALVRDRGGVRESLRDALERAREEVCVCEECGGFTVKDANPCAICSDAGRDKTILCVVEEPGDIVALERAGVYRGLYHVLGGKVSSADSPADMRLDSLVRRARNGIVKEVVLATATDMEGDATAAFIEETLGHNEGLAVTRLAFGLPVDSGIVYSDPVTLKRALAGRR